MAYNASGEGCRRRRGVVNTGEVGRVGIVTDGWGMWYSGRMSLCEDIKGIFL